MATSWRPRLGVNNLLATHREFCKNFAKINKFIFAKLREIQNNFVNILFPCFAKFLKRLFRSHTTREIDQEEGWMSREIDLEEGWMFREIDHLED